MMLNLRKFCLKRSLSPVLYIVPMLSNDVFLLDLSGFVQFLNTAMAMIWISF